MPAYYKVARLAWEPGPGRVESVTRRGSHGSPVQLCQLRGGKEGALVYRKLCPPSQEATIQEARRAYRVLWDPRTLSRAPLQAFVCVCGTCYVQRNCACPPPPPPPLQQAGSRVDKLLIQAGTQGGLLYCRRQKCRLHWTQVLEKKIGRKLGE